MIDVSTERGYPGCALQSLRDRQCRSVGLLGEHVVLETVGFDVAYERQQTGLVADRQRRA